MKNGFITDISTTLDTQIFFNFGGKVIRTYEGVICKENFKTSPFRNVIEILFNSIIKK